jgi:hypothetical protein
MRRAIVPLLVVGYAVVFVALLPAQGGGQAAREHTMTGCLQKGSDAGTYVVENTGQGPKTIGIVESDANLAPHVGHKIDITGTAVPTADAEKATPKPPKADHYMKLSSIKMVSTACP